MPLFAWAILFMVAAALLTAVVAKPPKTNPAGLADFDVPQVDEGTPHAVVFGDVWLQGWQVLWYGNLRTKKIKKKSLLGSTTIGYWYYMSMLSGLCRGPINELVGIKVGDQMAWEGHACGDTALPIDKANLFGGKKKEGGIQGIFRLNLGKKDQVLPGTTGVISIGGSGPNNQGTLPGVREMIQAQGFRVSQFRGVATLWYDGIVSAMSAYLKTWQFRVRRTTAGWENDNVWYTNKAPIYMRNDLLICSSSSRALSITAYGDGATITVVGTPNDGDTLIVGPSVFTFRTNPADDHDILIAPKPPNDANLTAQNGLVAGMLDTFADEAEIEITAQDNHSTTLKLNTQDGVIHAMNPAHILWEAHTNTEWGRGLTWDRMDDNSFKVAANTLCNEGFGLCLAWYRKEEVGDFIQKICDHIGCVIYVNRMNGLITIKLIRSDYVVADLPVYKLGAGLLSVSEDDSATGDQAYNEVTVTGTDPLSGKTFQVKADHLASFQSTGAINTNDQTYEGLPTGALGARVALRDLGTSVIGLKRLKLVFDRRAYLIAPGEVFVVQAPERGIASMIVRAGEIEDGTLQDGHITITTVQDVFGLPATAFITPTKSQWTQPGAQAAPPTDELFYELPYRDVVNRYGIANAAAVTPTTGFVGDLALPPVGGAYSYTLRTHVGVSGQVEEDEDQSFTDATVTTAAIGEADVHIPVADSSIFSVGEAVVIGTEYCAVVNMAVGVLTVKRGCCDTVPGVFASGVRVWRVDEAIGIDDQTYTVGQVVYGEVLTETANDIMDPSEGVEHSLTIKGRQALPLPPAGVQVNGTAYTALTGSIAVPTLTWVGRNRLTQATTLLGQLDGGVTEEAGTLYRVRVYADDGTTLLSTHDAVASGWVYDAGLQAADGNPPVVYFELESYIDDRPSWTHYRFIVVITSGWGYGWGFNWGGNAA